MDTGYLSAYKPKIIPCILCSLPFSAPPWAAAPWFFIGSGIVWLLDTGFANFLPGRQVDPMFLIGSGLGGILASIFLYYINFSDRSRETFTVPHHSLIIEEYPVP